MSDYSVDCLTVQIIGNSVLREFLQFSLPEYGTRQIRIRTSDDQSPMASQHCMSHEIKSTY